MTERLVNGRFYQSNATFSLAMFARILRVASRAECASQPASASKAMAEGSGTEPAAAEVSLPDEEISVIDVAVAIGVALHEQGLWRCRNQRSSELDRPRLRRVSVEVARRHLAISWS